MAAFLSSRWRLLLLLSLLALLAGAPSLAAAQTEPAPSSAQPSAYWRYDAPGPLALVATGDVNQDGLDEFILTTDDSQVVLLNASGRSLWTYQVPNEAPITALSTVNVDGSLQPDLEILLVAGSRLILLDDAGQQIWEKPLAPLPTSLVTSDDEIASRYLQLNDVKTAANFDRENDGNEEILILRRSGVLDLYAGDGELLWQEVTTELADGNDPLAKMKTADVTGDGRHEILLSTFETFSSLLLLDGDRRTLWQRSLSGRVTAMTFVRFDAAGAPYIAVGNSFRGERVILYDSFGVERWFRTPNRRITELTPMPRAQGEILLVGTDVGTVTAYGQQNGDGIRLWRYQPASADRGVISLSTNPPRAQDSRTAVAFTLGAANSRGASADVVLLDRNGQELQSYPSAASSGQTGLIDVNHDGISELLLASFGTLSLTDPGTGARKNAPAWENPLAYPLSMVVSDIDTDSQDELLVGGRDGKLHLLEGNNGQVSWRQPLGGEVDALAPVPVAEGETPLLAVAHNIPAEGGRSGQTREGWLELWQPGRSVWPAPQKLEGAVTEVAAGAIGVAPTPIIVAGTERGDVLAYSLQQEELWRATVPAGVEHLLLADFDGDDAVEVIVATSRNELFTVDGRGQATPLAYYNVRDIEAVYPLAGGEADGRALLIVTGDGGLRALNRDGIEVWQWHLPFGEPTLVRPAGQNFLVAGSTGHLFYLDVANEQLLWQLDDVGDVTDVYWGNLDGGGAQDLAIGTRSRNGGGAVYLYTSERRQWDSLNLNSGVLWLGGLSLAADQEAQLVVITDNGVVQMFEAKPNRPPLLVNPQVEVGPGRYVVRLSVIEEEGDEVTVGLETFDGEANVWRLQEERVYPQDTLAFPISPEGTEPVRYRFTFDDGTHHGVVEPAIGPAPQAVSTLRGNVVAPILISLVLLSALILIRQSLSTEARTGRFYSRLKQQPAATLQQFSAEYSRTGGSPGFLLNLANRARVDGNRALANLADGLFLLKTRPAAALPIINNALNQAKGRDVPWRDLNLWQTTYETGQSLLEAPTITELGLLRPQLVQMVKAREEAGRSSQGMEGLLRALASLRDSERVDLVEDRLVYLHEASIILRQVEDTLAEERTAVENELVRAIIERWLGLINAEVERLRGQAQLVISLKTKRVVPQDGQATIALEIENHGRAEAENVAVSVEENPAYSIHSPPEVIPVLSPGRSHEVDFAVEPHVDDRFRVAFKVHFDDRIEHDRHLAFADMVHLLPPVREFTPIGNPYTPGTPLRRNSPLFYGREDLFQFITENAGRLDGRNVLMLVGQRRSGKTSALLRLEHHLPADVIPVYVDCQSLGVLPGMAALLHDLAWLIADALLARGHQIDVADPQSWRDDPAGRFQRQFLPAIRETLPANATVLLVFDEFEAFENLVNDDILPPTFFTFMRHLMQHSEGLGFVFVGTHRLEEMSSDYWSILFNIALYRQIGFLDKEATMKLIQEPVAPHIVYDDLALDKIWRVTAGHPYFLQLVCYTLIKRANSRGTGYVTISDVNAALEEMLRLGEVHFAYIWQRSTHTERALLTAVAHLMDRDVPFHPADLVQYLEQYGFRLEPADVTAGLNRLVERDIMREITDEGTTLYELKIGLVGLWAAQNKSLSKLYESRNGDTSPEYPQLERT
ncbi:MAG: AAA family ATPase [Candidatus Promineifilaceae bacterium]|nr:AAA family ATPase [Candidatus Promineifilaceae bacterium]